MSTDATEAQIQKYADNPLGLPAGTVRGTMALLICGFVWLVLLWPHEGVKLPLAHYFLGSMVFMAFVTNPHVQGKRGAITPWLLRFLFIGGTAGVFVYSAYSDWHQVMDRLLPEDAEFRGWWLPYFGWTGGGFLFGHLLRVVFGNKNPFFQTLRAWLSVLGIFMMLGEYLLFIAFASATDNRPEMFMHVWQSIQLAAVSAYFGART